MQFGQRQHTGDLAVAALGDEIMTALAASARHRDAPGGQMEGRALGMIVDERADPRAVDRVAQIGDAQPDRPLEHRRVHCNRSASAATTASIRPHACPAINVRSLPAIAPSRL